MSSPLLIVYTSLLQLNYQTGKMTRDREMGNHMRDLLLQIRKYHLIVSYI